jgi:uncharacterized protein (TIGR02271 family)
LQFDRLERSGDAALHSQPAEPEEAIMERMRTRVTEGMGVRTADGEKLGKVVACQATGFVVEKGFLFPKDTLVPYERISAVSNGELVLSLAKAELGEAGVGRTAAETARAAAGTVAGETKGAVQRMKEAVTGSGELAEAKLGHPGKEILDTFGTAGEIRVPLTEEEVITGKRVEKVGEIHVRKEIITEEKQLSVPVMREVVRVERVQVSHDAHVEDRPFEEVSYDIPIREEHITVEKHPVVREEVRIGKEIQRGEETASATVRRERAEVETLGAVRRAEGALSEGPALRPTGTGGR